MVTAGRAFSYVTAQTETTAAADANGSVDALGPGELLAMQFTVILKGVCAANQSAEMANDGA